MATEYSLVTTHGAVMRHLRDHGNDTGREIAVAVGITERTALKVMGELEGQGYLSKERHGRKSHHEITDRGQLALREALA